MTGSEVITSNCTFRIARACPLSVGVAMTGFAPSLTSLLRPDTYTILATTFCVTTPREDAERGTDPDPNSGPQIALNLVNTHIT